MADWWNVLQWDWSGIGQLDWSGLGQTVLGAGVGTALVQAILPLYAEHRKKKAHATYLAMRLAVLLEQYGAACTEFVYENLNAHQRPDQEFPDWNTSIPELPDLPVDDEGWRSLDQTLAAQVLNLPNRIRQSQSIVASTIEYSEGELGEVLQIEACERGIEGWSLASLLRGRYRVQLTEPLWDYSDDLSRKLKQAKETSSLKEAKQREFSKSLFDVLNGTPPPKTPQ